MTMTYFRKLALAAVLALTAVTTVGATTVLMSEPAYAGSRHP
jgi:hypothetical protein